MSKIRDHFSDARWRAANGRVKVSDAWYRAVGRHVQGARQQARNEQNRRMFERGKLPRRDLAASAVASRTPVYRNRVNPATGRPHRDDAQLTRTRNESLARMKTQDRARQGRTPR